MSDEQIKVEFGADVAPLASGNEAARQSVAKTVQAMKADFASLAASTRQSFEGIGQQAANVTARMTDIGEQTEKMSRSAVIGLGELARGIGQVAQSGQLGAFAMREFSGAATRLGTAIGPAGDLAGIFVMLGGVIVETFMKARSEIEKTREKFATELAQMVNAGDSAALMKQAQDLFRGTPAQHFQDGIRAMQQQQKELQAQVDKTGVSYDAKTGLPKSMADPDLVLRLYNLSQALNEKTKEFEKLRQAILDVNNTPLKIAGLEPVKITATSPNAKGLPSDLLNAIAAANAQMALGDVESSNLGIDKALAKMRQQAEAAGRQYTEMTLKNQGKEAENQGALNALVERQLEHRAQVNAKVLEQMAADGKKWITEQAASWDTLFKGIENSWSRAVRTIQSGHDALKNFWRDVWHDMVRSAALGEMQILQSHLAMWLARKQITTKGVLEEVALYLASGLKAIAVSAAQAAAAAWASISLIPFVGPFLAPAVAAGTLAGVIALGSHIRSAAGGYDIPAGLNPVTQLHAQEMVLPAELANRIRGMTGGGGETHVHLHVQAIDHNDVKKFMKKNRSAVADAAINAVRNGQRSRRTGDI